MGQRRRAGVARRRRRSAVRRRFWRRAGLLAAALAFLFLGSLLAWFALAPAPQAALSVVEASLIGPPPSEPLRPTAKARREISPPPRPDASRLPSDTRKSAGHESRREPPGPSAAAARQPRPDSAAMPPPWRRFAVPVVLRPDRPRIAVVLDDMGLNRAAVRRATALPGPLTFAFLTYAEGLPQMTRAARAAGHELLLHLPMQAADPGEDGGPVVLESGAAREETLARLTWSLARFEGYVGVNNHMGSRFTADPEGMRTVLLELKRRGLLFLDSRTTAATVGEDLARALGVPTTSRDVFLDNLLEAAAITERLAEVERVARRKSHAVAIGHPHAATLAALAAWLPTLESRGFQLVPVSAIVRHRLELATRPGEAG